jgi:two-component system cell cycle response regulator DivK
MPKTILIVEDNDLNMKLFNDLLEAHGYATLQTKMAGKSCNALTSS